MKTARASFLLLFPLFLPPVTAAAQCEVFWQPRLFAQAQSASVDLVHNRRTVATIPTSWFIALDHINKKINRASGVDARLLLCGSRPPNAFAWRDKKRNFVALTLGMYRLLGDDWDAYAAILGHENAHLVKNHGHKRQERRAWSHLGQLLARKLLVERGAVETGLAIDGIRIGADAITSNYSREEEHEADEYGMIYAHGAGFDPRGALSFHAKMKSAGSFLSSHPSSKERLRNLEKELRRRGW